MPGGRGFSVLDVHEANILAIFYIFGLFLKGRSEALLGPQWGGIGHLEVAYTYNPYIPPPSYTMYAVFVYLKVHKNHAR